MGYKEIEGNLIDLALLGQFDVISHGCNCFCTMRSGIAPQMDARFLCNNPSWYSLEDKEYKGDINKLGQIQDAHFFVVQNKYGYYEVYNHKYTVDLNFIVDEKDSRLGVKVREEGFTMIKHSLYVVNSYTQYNYGAGFNGRTVQLDYDALTLCMRKINSKFKGKEIGLPMIGAGKAGGDWDKIRNIIKIELMDCNTTIVKLKE